MAEYKATRAGLYYGWYVLAAAFGTIFIGVGVRNSFGLFFKPILADFDLSRAGLSLAVSIFMIVYGVAQPVLGNLLDRYGPRLVITLSSILFGLGLFSMGVISSLWQLYLVYGVIIAVGSGGVTFVTLTAMLSRWFVRRRGTALGIATSGSSVGQFVIVPLATYLLIIYGWRWTQIWLAVIVLVTIVPLALWVMKREPSQVGGGPDALPLETTLGREDSYSPLLARSVTPARAFRTRPFWQLSASFFACGFSGFLIVTHIVAHATDLGYSNVVAATILALMGAVNFAGILGMSSLSDKIGRKIPLATVYFLKALALLILMSTESLFGLYIFAMVVGFTAMATIPLTSALLGDIFGSAYLGTIFGVASLVHQVGAALGVFLGGLFFDLTGSYYYAFFAAFVFCLMASILSYSIEEPERTVHKALGPAPGPVLTKAREH